MQRKTMQPTSVKVVIPIEHINPRKRLSPETKLMDLGWAIRKGLVRLETDPNLTNMASSGRIVNHNGSVRYILKKMPPVQRTQPQVRTILETLKGLGGEASREQLLKALKTKLDTKQSPATVFSLKRKVMLDNGWLRIA
jgi:hypothetical protein